MAPSLPGKKLTLFFSFCALFLVIRAGIVLTATDSIRHASPEEYQIISIAQQINQGKAPQSHLSHLWGLVPTAYAASILLKLGLSATEALKLMAVLISLVGFLSLTYLFFRSTNQFTASLFALLMVFPHLTFMKWTLTMWGGYPEAASLVGLPVMFFGLSLKEKKNGLLFISAILFGLTVSYSASIIYIPLAAGLYVLFISLRLRKLKQPMVFVAGMFIGLLPLIIWMLAGKWESLFEEIVFMNDKPLSGLEALSFPSFENLQRFLGGKAIKNFEVSQFSKYLCCISIGWVAFQNLRPQQLLMDKKWQGLFPLSIFSAALILSVFPFGQFIDVRHLLWIFPAGYACFAITAGDFFSYFNKNELPGRHVKMGKWLLIFGVAAILAVGAFRVLSIMQPSNIGVLFHYRGDVYSSKTSMNIVGPEVKRVNRLMDAHPEYFQNFTPFYQGFSSGFLPTRQNRFCIASEFDVADTSEKLAGIAFDQKEAFATGFGCAIALKDKGNPEKIYTHLPMEFKGSIESGVALCSEYR